MVYILDKLDFSLKICNIIKSVYKKTKCKYIFGEIETDWVTLERGVRQGCVLSLILFFLHTEELAASVGGSGLGVNIIGNINKHYFICWWYCFNFLKWGYDSRATEYR